MKKERLFSPIFVIIIAASLCSFLVGQGSNAGTSVYLDKVGGSTGLAGIGALTFSFAAAISRIICGPIIDTRGRQMIMVSGSIVMLLGTLGPLIDNTGALFILWRILQGFGFAAGTTAAATAAADVLPFSRLGEGIGYYGLGQAISMSIGPALAIFLISTDPPENFYLGLSACAALSILFALACRYEKDPLNLPATAEYRVRWERGEVGREEAGAAEPLEEAQPSGKTVALSPASEASSTPSRLRRFLDSIFEPSALPGTIPVMFIATSFGFGIFYVGVLGAHLQVGNAGIFYTTSAILMIIIRLISGTFMDRIRSIKIMGIAVICGLVCFAMLFACSLWEGSPQSEWIFYLTGVPYGISLGIALPVNQTVAVRLTPPKRWGAANSLFLLGNDIAIGLSSLLWGFTIQSFGFSTTLLVIMGFIALSFGAALICYPKEEEPEGKA